MRKTFTFKHNCSSFLHSCSGIEPSSRPLCAVLMSSRAQPLRYYAILRFQQSECMGRGGLEKLYEPVRGWQSRRRCTRWGRRRSTCPQSWQSRDCSAATRRRSWVRVGRDWSGSDAQDYICRDKKKGSAFHWGTMEYKRGSSLTQGWMHKTMIMGSFLDTDKCVGILSPFHISDSQIQLPSANEEFAMCTNVGQSLQVQSVKKIFGTQKSPNEAPNKH